MSVLGFAVKLHPAGSSKTEPETDTDAQASTATIYSEKPRWKLHDSPPFSLSEKQLKGRELCVVCIKAALDEHACPDCKLARYCSVKCQDLDSSTHKRICAGFRNHLSEARPSENHYRAVFFPCNSEDPEFVWLKVLLDHATGILHFETDKSHALDYVEQLGQPNVCCLNLNNEDVIENARFSHGFDLIVFNKNENNSRDLQWSNRCLLSFGKPGFLSCVFGPTFLWAYDLNTDIDNENGESSNGDWSLNRCRDIELRDLRHTIDCYVLNINNPAVSDDSMLGIAPYIMPALKINDLDDKTMQALGVTQQMEMTKAWRPLEGQALSTFRDLNMFYIGLRWYIRSALPVLRDPLLEAHGRHGDVLNIFKYTFECKDKSNDFEHLDTPRYLKLCEFRHTASFNLFQVNGGFIRPAHVQAVMGYFKMAKATRTEPSEKGFRAYWDWFKRSETKKGHSLDDVPSPYDLEEVDDVGFDIWSQHLVSIIQSRPSLESFLNTTRVSRV